MALEILTIGFCLFLILVPNSFAYNGPRIRSIDPDRACQPITMAACRNVGYNYTRQPAYPSGPPDQDSAASILEEFRPLINTRCSERLTFLLCSTVAPMCTQQVDALITSCRSVCSEVKSACLPWLRRAGHSWPDLLNCSKFPVKGAQGTLCMDPSLSDDE